MALSQKCQYAVRAVLELAVRYGQGAVPASEIAASQSIPQRFLEVILNELKPTGLLESRRGVQGGYYLTSDPAEITVAQVIRAVEGPLDPVRCTGDRQTACCPLQGGGCALSELWDRARDAVEEVYESATFASIVERQKELRRQGIVDYTI